MPNSIKSLKIIVQNKKVSEKNHQTRSCNAYSAVKHKFTKNCCAVRIWYKNLQANGRYI